MKRGKRRLTRLVFISPMFLYGWAISSPERNPTAAMAIDGGEGMADVSKKAIE